MLYQGAFRVYVFLTVLVFAAAGYLLLAVAQQPPGGPSLEPVLGKVAEGQWLHKAGTFAIAADAALGKPVLTVQKAALILESKSAHKGGLELRALLRLQSREVGALSADFQIAKKDAKDLGLRLLLTTTKDADAINCQVQQGGKTLHDIAALAKTIDWTPDFQNSFTYYPRAYPLKTNKPDWEPDFRARIQRDMTAIPGVHEKWLEVRFQARPGEVRCWLDDRLVAVKRNADVTGDGLLRVELSPGVQMAGLEVGPWNPTPGFLPVRLAGYANARSNSAATVLTPLASRAVAVDGIPFLLAAPNAEGNDFIHVNKSLYRHANLKGYFPSYEHRWIGAARRDPARIQLRIPNGQYDSLYLLAASSGQPDHVPLVTAMFYRPGAGFAESFETRVPLATAKATEGRLVPVVLGNGKTMNCWLVKVPLDPGRLSTFADMDIIEVELTKRVHQFRSYPDPFIYGWHQGGPPSSVQIYGLTLGTVPVRYEFTPDKFGHVWTAPAIPSYTAKLTNLTGGPALGKLTVQTRCYDGSETIAQEKTFQLPAGQVAPVQFSFPVKLNGYHEITATLNIGNRTWTEKRSFVRLAPDTRAAKWTEGKGALFGYWSYHGGHHTPKAERHVELMTAAGARTSIGWPGNFSPALQHWSKVPAQAWEVSPQPWAAAEPFDAKKVTDFQKATVEAFTKIRAPVPAERRPDHVYFFPEPHVSQRLTEGNYAAYWNGTDPPMTAEEQKTLKIHYNTARIAAETVRKNFPELKILIPWGDPLYAVPLLRAGFPKHLIDGSGLDNPAFERLPEMQLHHIALHRLYILRKEYEKAGILHPQLQYSEGPFVPTEPGAVSVREQMDLYHRFTLLSMAYGVKRFYSGWFAFDCGNYYGSEHYGGCGIQRRIPYCDPKPAYAAYATMTDRLDQANFTGWIKTGSLSTYCLHFTGPKGHVYALWTLRGKRPVTLTFKADGAVAVTDSMNNSRSVASQGKQITVATDPSVIYVTAAGEVVSAAVGEPDHSDVAPAKDSKMIADLGDGTWQYSNKQDEVYEKGHYSIARFPGKFRGQVFQGPAPEKVLCSTLEKQATEHPLMPWYNILVPRKPIALQGAPSHLGLWVRGSSDWGRVIYVLRDAKGEKWTSIGTQDEYNCDDVHSWSAFNFDGWRYVRFELPGHTGYDNFRKHGTTWWRSDGGDSIVDLPLTLESIIVEQRTHVLYVNDVQPAAGDSVSFGKLYVEYAVPEDATAEAVRISKLRMPQPK
jgi:hypothetical protein